MKTLYKDKLLNLAATMAQSLGFNNAKKGKLQSTNVQDAIDELAMRDEMISDAWVSSATYPVGGYCIYNNKLWRCLVQNSNSAPSSSNSNWLYVSVGSELGKSGDYEIIYDEYVNTTSSSTSITWSSINNFKELQIMMRGDDNNGNSLSLNVKFLLDGMGWPFCFYSQNNSAGYSPSGYFMHAQGKVTKDGIYFQRVDGGSWGCIEIVVVGVK